MAFKLKIPYLLIEPYIFLYVSSMILNGIVLPQLILDNVCKLNFNTTVCNSIYESQYKEEQDNVQKKSALWITALYTSMSALVLVTLPILGPLADTIGTHKAMYLNPFLLGVQCIICIILKISGQTFDTTLLLLAIPIVAFSGDYSGVLMFACSYIANQVIEKNRTFRINLLECAFSLASGLFALLSGFILLQFGYTGAFLISLCLCILDIIYLKLFVHDHRQIRKSEPTFSKQLQARNKLQATEEAVGLVDDCVVGLQDEYPFENNISVNVKDEKNNRSDSVSDEISSKMDSSNDNISINSNENKNGFLNNNSNGLLPFTSSLKQKTQHVNKHSKHDINDNNIIVRSPEVNNMHPDIASPIDHKHENNNINSKEYTDSTTCDTKPTDASTESSKNTLKDILAKANPYTNFKKLHQILEEQNQLWAVIFLLVGSFTSMIAWIGEYRLLVIFVKSRPLNFTETDVGYFLALQSITWAVGGYLFLNFITERCLKCRDTLIITVSLAFHALYLVLLGFSTSKTMIYCVQLLSAFAALDITCIRSTLTKRVSSNAYGTVLACCATLEALGALVGTIGSTVVYAEMITFHRGSGFFFIAIFPSLASLLIAYLYWKERSSND